MVPPGADENVFFSFGDYGTVCCPFQTSYGILAFICLPSVCIVRMRIHLHTVLFYVCWPDSAGIGLRICCLLILISPLSNPFCTRFGTSILALLWILFDFYPFWFAGSFGSFGTCPFLITILPPSPIAKKMLQDLLSLILYRYPYKHFGVVANLFDHFPFVFHTQIRWSSFLVHWIKRPFPLLKMNVDGSSLGNPSFSGVALLSVIVMV